MNCFRTTLFFILVAAAHGCSGDRPEPDQVLRSPAPGASALSVDRLRNAAYKDIFREPVTLIDGRFEGEPFASGAASRPVVTVVPDAMATGDLTGDGIDEAVVALAHSAGGSGVFIYLAIVRDDSGNPDNTATISLGDRVRVTALAIEEGRIIADLVEHGPNDPMCCPTNNIRREWQLQDGAPVQSGSASEPQAGRFIGHLVWGHESRSFTECGGGREGWVINDSGDELVRVYEELTSAPYQHMFVEVRGEWVEAPEEGFGAEFAEALRVTELVRAENEGFGCRLELAGVLFIASGNEPFWRMQIREDGILMRSVEASGEIEFPAIRMRGQPPQVIYDAKGPDSAIRISLEQRRCIDTMSGARYSWAATVDAGGRQYRGCAAEGI